MIEVYTGLPGSCKTTYLASVALDCLKRNQRLHTRTGVARYVYSNVRFSPLIEKEYSHLLRYYHDVYQLDSFRDCDIIIDELSIYFDAHEWERIPKRIKRYLRLHRHYDVNIYAVAQDFLTIDKTFRRLVKYLYLVERLIGTREPSPFKPKIKRPFVFSAIRLVEPSMYEVEKEHYKFSSSIYKFFTRKHFAIFDTREELPEQELPPLIKEVRVCPDDNFRRVRYY